MLIPVLLTGGSGTRLWPLSRKQHPKQFLNLVGDNSMLEDTVARVRDLPEAGPVLAIGGEDHRFIVAEHLRRAQAGDAQIVLEPQGRNTAPAAAVAAYHIERKFGPDTLMMLCPADHAIADTPAFRSATATAMQAAASGALVTFGITPDRPETGYGYIRAGAVRADGAHALVEFKEKPDLETAQRYVDSGEYFWNSGMFVFTAGSFIAQLEQHAPEIATACRAALAGASSDGIFLRLEPQAFGACPSDSIDYAVMEKTDSAAMVPLDCGWNDVGSWSFLRTIGDADVHGNVVQGDVMLEDVEDCAIRAEDRLVAAVGLRDMVIVATKDAVLVTPQDRAQDVKAIVQRLVASDRNEAHLHPRVYRPWGSYEGVDSGSRFQVKRIVVNPGAQLSLQMHHHRAEHWIVVKGTARVTCGDKVFLLGEDESTYIPLGTTHRLENPGTIPLELIEVQTGSYLGEDDIVRFEDSYGRDTPAQ